jgi:hypothetical protein
MTQTLKEMNSGKITIKVKSFADPIFLALRLIDGLTSE